jgi:hypothetical protein
MRPDTRPRGRRRTPRGPGVDTPSTLRHHQARRHPHPRIRAPEIYSVQIRDDPTGAQGRDPRRSRLVPSGYRRRESRSGAAHRSSSGASVLSPQRRSCFRGGRPVNRPILVPQGWRPAARDAVAQKEVAAHRRVLLLPRCGTEYATCPGARVSSDASVSGAGRLRSRSCTKAGFGDRDQDELRCAGRSAANRFMSPPGT